MDLVCLAVNDNLLLIFGHIHPWKNIHPSPISYSVTFNLSRYGQLYVSLRIQPRFICAPSQESLHLKISLKMYLPLEARAHAKGQPLKSHEKPSENKLCKIAANQDCFWLVYSLPPPPPPRADVLEQL